MNLKDINWITIAVIVHQKDDTRKRYVEPINIVDGQIYIYSDLADDYVLLSQKGIDVIKNIISLMEELRNER